MSDTPYGGGHPNVARAEALLSVGRIDDACDLLTSHTKEVSHKDADVYALLAWCFYRMQKWPAALVMAESALSLNPSHTDGHICRSEALWRLGRADEAVTAAREAIRISPHHQTPYQSLSAALRATGDLDGALAAANESVRVSPESANAHFARYYALLDMGDNAGAQQVMRDVLSFAPEDADARAVLAGLKDENRELRLPELAREYTAALGADPGSAHITAKLEDVALRLVRRTRWVALLCLVYAAVTSRAFPTGDDPTSLPAPLGPRMWFFFLMCVGWGVCVWRTYFTLPKGAQLTLLSVIRRAFAAKLAVAHSLWGTLCAVLLVTVPWTDRGYEQALVWIGGVPVVLAMWYGAAQRRNERDAAEKAKEKRLKAAREKESEAAR
ncbi:translation initiation factor IF-2 [Streptomyces roseoverticillatus]|uniref:tetratricopeptide repeat protein n=1 Tax=Streptomyces roseoverticillatus TaxID=66429 RepID=UPI001F455FE0|nr:translation initiation factor IF-2 [Streptomyces roseoverticillatus]MCF3106014.1 translation initiation factor IF-2 [Streptomyces roseoverticillatus]